LVPSLLSNHPSTTDIYSLSLHDALPISALRFSRSVAKFLQVLAQFTRQCRAHFDPCPGPRLRKPELCRVQKITLERRQRDLPYTQFLCRSIQRIAHYWMLHRREVHSNLMRSPGVEFDFHQLRVVDLPEP